MEFSETQKFRKGWLLVLFAITFFMAVCMPLAAAWKTGEHDAAWVALIGAFIILSTAALIFSSHMDTHIDHSGIRLHFKYFLWREKVWNWGDIKAAYVRNYNPILEYGGWGIRLTISNGRAYNVSGSNGLQLLLENGKKVLIGTQKPEELEQMLQYLRSHHKIQIRSEHKEKE